MFGGGEWGREACPGRVQGRGGSQDVQSVCCAARHACAEWFDSATDKTHIYSDLYVLNVEKQTWRKVVSPKGCAQRRGCPPGAQWQPARWRRCRGRPAGDEGLRPACRPLPRTSHQAVCTRQALWVFGGEYTSLNQEKFRHFNDLWRLTLADWSWDNISPKGGPSPRSGHRMLLIGRKFYLFGGFYDTCARPAASAAGWSAASTC